MAQKKKVPVSVKPAAKPVARKAQAAKVAAPPMKTAPMKIAPMKTAKVQAKAKPAVAPVVAAKVAAVAKPKIPAAPVKVIKKVVLPVKPAVAAKATPADLKKPIMTAGLAKTAPASAQRAVPAAAHKLASQKLTAAVSGHAQSPKSIAEKTAAARQMISVQKKPVNQRHGFKANEFVVYPAHGVGRIVGIEEQEIAGMSLELFVITFDKEKLTLRVPTGKLASVGMRKLADDAIVKKAMETLKGRARIKRTMWSRRAQEYVAKINSGDLISIAEVVRDLYRSEAQPEQSYSERQLYEDALDRMARELAAVEKLDERGAVQRITEILSKSAKSRRAAESDGVSEAA